ncbi:hypothetical protein MAE02_09410 [Microvirga aerophila]|uniref:Uncharacterized protein n=2 Tax=Microvirga aerophila TaxID=670291 RepID=A0A512BMX0_9HYPH|nr:hypothetical protein MAE02_09410 [Microvirga aerophila]
MIARRKEWNTSGLALLGAGIGALVGGVHEIGEAYLHSPTEQESFAYMLAEIAASMIIGALFFASVSIAYNLMVRTITEKKPDTAKRWDPVGLAFIGAGVGLMLVVVHEAFVIFSGDFNDVDPFTHIMVEMIILAIVGALAFAAIAEIRNRLWRS